MGHIDDNLKHIFAEAIYKESGLDKDVCDEISFHMIDWKGELIELCQLLHDPSEYSSKQIMQIIQAFLMHATEHSMAASELLLGYTPENIFRK